MTANKKFEWEELSRKDGRLRYLFIPVPPLRLQCVFSINKNWRHVSVVVVNKSGKLIKRCPTWSEMCIAKNMFFGDDQAIIQVHPKKEENINYHPYCLHLWKHDTEEMILPPKELVNG